MDTPMFSPSASDLTPDKGNNIMAQTSRIYSKDDRIMRVA